jgi:hypothetical protein
MNVLLVCEGSVPFLTCVLMTDNELSSELRACVDIDTRGRSGGRMVLKSVPVTGAVVC